MSATGTGATGSSRRGSGGTGSGRTGSGGTGSGSTGLVEPDSLDGRSDRAFAAGSDAPAAGGGSRGWWRRNRAVVLVVLVAVVGVLAGLLTTPRAAGDPLSPTSAAPGGSRAVAEILGRGGVDVREETTLAGVLDAAGPGTTLLVLDSDVLDPDQLRQLRDSGADLVLVDPSLPVLQVLAPELTIAGSASAYVADPGCDDPDAQVAGPARAGGNRYVQATGGAVPGVEREPRSPDAEVAVCYPSGDGPTPEAGSYAVVTEPGGRRVVVHGQPDVLTNEWLPQEGNAALALRSLGQEPTLLWYRVDPLDVVLADGEEPPPDALDLLPRWVGWAVAQLLVVAAVAVLWRFRRLGRLVPERLPAVVRSVETTEGRARLYRAAGARGASALVLRRATTSRLAARLATGRVDDPATLTRLAAAASGRDPVEVARLLEGPPPTDDVGLVRLADDLDRLEREVSHR